MSEELAWAAGLFCGEGSTYWRGSIRKSNNREYGAPAIEVAQAGDPWVLERFQSAVGGFGKINGPYDNKPGRRPYYQYSAGARAEVREILRLLWPWLSPDKKKQAETIFAKDDEYLARPFLRSGKYKTLPAVAA